MYSFDPSTGKMSAVTDLVNGSQSKSYTYSAAHPHAVEEIDPGHAGVEYTYDANGNMLSRVEGGVAYTQSWTPDNRLAKVTWTNGANTLEARFYYDGNGSRLLRVSSVNGVETAKTVYIGGMYEKELLSGGETKYYAFGGRTIAMRKKASATAAPVIYYLFGDHLGSNSMTLDLAGEPQGVARYLPYGQPRAIKNSLLTDKTFTGQRAEDFGLMDYNARYLQSYITQFTQPDTIIPDPYNPLDWNRYSYARNNPINYNDPSGHCTGNPYDSKNPDIDCWIQYEKLKSKYSSVSIDSKFDMAFLLMIGQSLDLILGAFDNDMGAFQKGLGNFSIKYVSWVDRAVAPPGLDTVYLGYSAVVQNNSLADDAIQVIIHEIGHVFDFNGDSVHKSQLFTDILSKGSCNSGALGCLGPKASDLYKALNKVSGGGTDGYNPLGAPSAYGATSSIDDFADSFAGYVLRFNGLSTKGIPTDGKRDMIIATFIDLAGR